jgi:uncharacterized protein YggE
MMTNNRTINVTGRGSIHVVPDVTRLEITIESVFKTYEDAYEQAKENNKWMMQILEYNHKSGKLAKTIRLDITDHTISEYDEKDHYIGEIKDGFDLNQSFKIDLEIDPVLLNKIIRGVGKFIQGAQISIGYTIRDPRPSQLKMLERAVKDAAEKAKIMAEAAGCKLGSVANIYYNHQEINVYSQARNIHSNKEAMACDSSSLNISPDDLVMSDNVKVEWELKDN